MTSRVVERRSEMGTIVEAPNPGLDTCQIVRQWREYERSELSQYVPEVEALRRHSFETNSRHRLLVTRYRYTVI